MWTVTGSLDWVATCKGGFAVSLLMIAVSWASHILGTALIPLSPPLAKSRVRYFKPFVAANSSVIAFVGTANFSGWILICEGWVGSAAAASGAKTITRYCGCRLPMSPLVGNEFILCLPSSSFPSHTHLPEEKTFKLKLFLDDPDEELERWSF